MSSGSSQASNMPNLNASPSPKACKPNAINAAPHHQRRRWRKDNFSSAMASVANGPRASGLSRRSSQRSREPACVRDFAAELLRAAAQSSKGAAINTPNIAIANQSARPNTSSTRTDQDFQTNSTGAFL